MQAQLAVLNQDLDQLAAKIDRSSDAIKAEAQPKLQALREQAAQLNKQLADVQNATESTWDSVKARHSKKPTPRWRKASRKPASG
jgi:predicted  nucleic acid-binding Zn-ribbon protein